MEKCDVFISHKSADVKLAKQLYQYLSDLGLTVFESDESLPKLGSSDYRKKIDEALDMCNHMIVIGSSVENLNSSWVEAEWGFFINEKRSGRKSGNIITVITDDLKIDNLPASLRNYEVIVFNKNNFPRIAEFMQIGTPPTIHITILEKLSGFFKKSKKIIALIFISIIAVITVYWLSMKTEPFDTTINLSAQEELRINANYPRFENGELSIYLSGKVDTKHVIANQEIVFKQIPASLFGEKVPAKLNSDFWMLDKDSIVLNKELTLAIIPNGKLEKIIGNIKDWNGNALENCKIVIDTDTTIFSDSKGVFKAFLPYSMQKEKYILSVNKEGFKPQRLDYYAGSGSIDILLKK